jgi:GNAT superfamily N-acetyltransferase
MNVPTPVAISEVTIRPAAGHDAIALTGLLSELGYQVETSLLRTRLPELTTAGDAALVAEHHGQVVGLVHLHRMHFLHRAPDGRIVTLVVAASFRSLGLGQQLLRAAEQVFREWGCGRIEVSSGAQREAAHRFYRREGFEEKPKRFVKVLTT